MTVPDVNGFVRAIIAEHQEYSADIDGGWLQDTAEKYGVLVPHTVTDACGDHCRCAEYCDWPATCYRLHPALAAPSAPPPAGRGGGGC